MVGMVTTHMVYGVGVSFFLQLTEWTQICLCQNMSCFFLISMN